MRVLFLDDDPRRASAFVFGRPDAVWVQTAEECIQLLGEPWDEIHLDHDLGGETFVDHDRDDCGMAVVRRLAESIHPHLAETRFVVHTHNETAARVMAFHLEVMGYRVELVPFGSVTNAEPPQIEPFRRSPWARRLLRWLSGRMD